MAAASNHFQITATGTFDLAAGAADAVVGTLVIMLVSNSFSGSISVQAKIAASAAWPSDSIAYVGHAYWSNYLNGTNAAATALVTTAITGTSLIYVPATQLRIALDCTAFTSGTMDVYMLPAIGAAA